MNNLDPFYYDRNEWQNAYTWSNLNKKPDDSEKIYQHVEDGKFVVVAEHTDFCPVTDATMGSSRYVSSVHDTREQAEDQLKNVFDRWDEDTNYYVLPVKKVEIPTLRASINSDSDIPF